jgi:fructose-1-phosphate kinase PfkB-like protein
VIVTITPNPSIDRTLQVQEVRRGEVIRARAASSEAGGKGINVSRALAVMGVATIAVAPASSTTRTRLDDLIDGSTSLRTIPIAGDIRVNLSLVEPDGTVTKINEPGPTLSEREATFFLEAVVDLVQKAFAAASAPAGRGGPGAGAGAGAGDFWVVGCGSLPPGLPDPFYASLAARLPPSVRMAVDCDRSALRAVIRTPIALLKPNRAELEEVIGHSLPTLGDVADAAAELVAGGAERVLVSLGPDGALISDRTGACHAEAAVDDVVNTVGAGDALLAGFLAGGATTAALATAVAWSVAACRAPGTQMPAVTGRDTAAVIVRPTVDRARRLAS